MGGEKCVSVISKTGVINSVLESRVVESFHSRKRSTGMEFKGRGCETKEEFEE